MASNFFLVMLPLNWAAICWVVHSPGVVRSRSRMAASCSLGFFGCLIFRAEPADEAVALFFGAIAIAVL
ncbi:MAG: hypothetical protein WA947_13985 [Phormidesmis sp.]